LRVIVLAAGQGFQLDGFNKLLIKDPRDGRTIMEKLEENFAGMSLTVVVGYRAIAVMHRYPHLDYVHNADWAVTNNAYSLALALDESPTYVVSCDLLFEPGLIERLQNGPDNAVLTQKRDSRTLSALNCDCEDDGTVRSIYQGPLRDAGDPEAIGVYKLSDRALLKEWRRRCFEYTNLFAGQNLPLDGASVHSIDVGGDRFEEVNTPDDYIRLLKKTGGNS